MREQFLWVEKYRPKTINDTILPANLKAVFQQFVEQGEIPNLILTGKAGVGKTTVARAMLEQLGCDYIVINGSLNAGIDILRNEITNFASSVSFSGGRKYVILDEADYLSAEKVQPALRNFMEEFSKNCGFILTCNFKNRIIEPLHSRCSVIDFDISNSEKAKLAKKFMVRVENILRNENIEFDTQVVAEIIMKYFPDWRRVLNELQRYSATGKIDSGILANSKEIIINELVKMIKEKDYTAVRKWVGQNSDMDHNTFFRVIYDKLLLELQPNCIPAVVVSLAEYQYKSAFVVDQEINTAAFLAELMITCNFKA